MRMKALICKVLGHSWIKRRSDYTTYTFWRHCRRCQRDEFLYEPGFIQTVDK